MKTCLIRQPAGLGDIFFTQKIAANIIKLKLADTIIWPVIKEYSYLSNYMLTKNVDFINENLEFPQKTIYTSSINHIVNTENFLYVPLQYADQTAKASTVMQSKYKFCGNLDYHDWKDYFCFQRNNERESKLIEYLHLNNDPFILINNNYGSENLRSLNNQRQINTKSNIKIIKMDYIEGFNIFDWIGVFERAKEIHTVETSLCYILYKLNLKNVIVYAKNYGAETFNNTKELFDSKWDYIL
jgi:hypothetical protein